jgi:hypothetical protein
VVKTSYGIKQPLLRPSRSCVMSVAESRIACGDLAGRRAFISHGTEALEPNRPQWVVTARLQVIVAKADCRCAQKKHGVLETYHPTSFPQRQPRTTLCQTTGDFRMRRWPDTNLCVISYISNSLVSPAPCKCGLAAAPGKVSMS